MVLNNINNKLLHCSEKGWYHGSDLICEEKL